MSIDPSRPRSSREKALAFNLDPRRYGTFAEIGAGQEVVRWFFQAGGASGTIAKSISAYDMTVSDAIYGNTPRYVCRERLQAMLDYEQSLNIDRLSGKRGDDCAFFTFADTVSARNFHGTNECHAWMGVKFQTHPRDENSQLVIHVRMLDDEVTLQQEALGIVGVNLLYGCAMLHHKPELLIESLLDGLTTDRIEVDMVEFSGIEFRRVDNRIMSLRLVQLGLTGAAMFAADGRVLQPSEAMRHHPVLVERGRFRPMTRVNADMIDCALRAFACAPELALPDARRRETLPLLEITMHNLLEGRGEIDLRDFISRVDALAPTGHHVLISGYFEYYRLASYLARCTDQPIGLAMGAGSLRELFNEAHYTALEGGILESFGRLFRSDLRLYIYPLRDTATGELMTVANLPVPETLRQLYAHLVGRGCIVPLPDFDPSVLHIFSPDVLAMIATNRPGWECMVPDGVAKVIREQRLFGSAHLA
jgi:hypothetical protein